jgi:hypothetical protein
MIVGGGMLKSSNSATLPYPTHQALATPPSSLARGDWGLKRPLPLRSTTRTSTPAVRISSIDTIEHITDFDSAADHTQTLQKWQEMNMPISNAALSRMNPARDSAKNVFERNLDSTDPKDALINNAIRAASNVKRWKVKGPWLAGMEAGEFTDYVRKELSRRKQEFKEYLDTYINRKVISAKKMMAMNQGNNLSDADIQVSKNDYNETLKLLRQDAQDASVDSELCARVIIPFLDLPPLKVEDQQFYASAVGGSRYALSEESTPMTTHPSAGLSYLRTKSYLTNHPILGPQEKPPPVPARVLAPQQTSTGGVDYAKLGVAGVVTNDSATYSRVGNVKGKSTLVLDTETYGGQKLWVEPVNATISPTGRIMLDTVRAQPYAVQVEMGELEDKMPTRRSKPLTTANRPSHVGPDGRPRMDDLIDEKPTSSTAGASGIGGTSGDNVKDLYERLRERFRQQQQR